jgi:hypothetical protein
MLIDKLQGYKSLLIGTILLVYRISDPKDLFTVLMPIEVNPKILPMENDIVIAHFFEMKRVFSLSQI